MHCGVGEDVRKASLSGREGELCGVKNYAKPALQVVTDDLGQRTAAPHPLSPLPPFLSPPPLLPMEVSPPEDSPPPDLSCVDAQKKWRHQIFPRRTIIGPRFTMV